MRGVQILGSCVFLKLCHEFISFPSNILLTFFSHATSCSPCAKAKATCKPFDVDKVQAKARAEVLQRSRARKTKQQMDAEWKLDVARKLDSLSELHGLRKDVWRIAVALEKLASIRD